MILEGLSTTEYWMLREQIKEVLIDVLDHRMDGPVYTVTVADQSKQKYDVTFSLNGGSILSPDKVKKL